MKTLLLSILIFSSLNAQADTATDILGWDSALPQAQNKVIHQIQTFAMENFYTEVEQSNCGGDTAAFELTDYYTFESFEGDLTHKVKVKILVTGSYNYCEGEVVSECEVPVTLYSENHVSMGKWNCTVVQLP